MHPASTVGLSGILNRSVNPVLLIDQRRTVLFHNHAADKLLKAEIGLRVQLGRLALSTQQGVRSRRPVMLECLPSLAQQADCCNERPSSGLAERQWLMTVSEFSETRRTRTFLIHLISRLHQRQLSAESLRDLFCLNEEDTAVLAGLLRNEPLGWIAACLALPPPAIRSHLRRILKKCQVRSRIELMALLHRMSLLSNRPT